jgi:hypothetical protein
MSATLLLLIVAPMILASFNFTELAAAQTSAWSVTMQTSASLEAASNGMTTKVIMSGTDGMHLTVEGNQITGTGESSYALGLTGDYDSGNTHGSISSDTISITKTLQIVGTMQSDNTADLTITETATTAPT